MSISLRILPAISQSTGGAAPPPSGSVGTITALQIINAATEAVIDSDVQNNDTYDLSAPIKTLKVTTTGTIGSLQWKIDGCEIHVDDNYPFILPNKLTNYSGLQTLSQSLVNNVAKPRSDKEAEIRQYVIDEYVVRPLNLGIGKRTIEITPYSGPDKTGVKGTPFIRTIEFNNGTSLGTSPASTNVSSWAALVSAVAGANHDDTIYVDPGIFASGNLTITKRLRIIGAGSGETVFTNFGTWNIVSGCSFQGFSIAGSTGTAFYAGSGFTGLFMNDIKASGKTKFLNTDGAASSGLVVDNVECTDFKGQHCDVFEFINTQCNHFYFSNLTIRNVHANTGSNAGRAHGLRLGSVAQEDDSGDIVLRNVLIDKVQSDDTGNAEVHGVYAFGWNIIYDRVWVKNIVPKKVSGNYLPDREAMGGKMTLSIIKDCWAHNGGATNQEGCFNFKRESAENVYIGNLVTCDNTINFGTAYTDAYFGWCFNLYGNAVVVANKGVNSQTTRGFGLASLRGGKQYWMCNEMYVYQDCFIRVANEPSLGAAALYSGDNFGAVRDRDGESSFYKLTGYPGDNYTVSYGDADEFCPASGNNGLSCTPIFSQSNWSDGHRLDE